VKDLIAEGLSLFFRPDDVLEVRALDVGRPGRKVAGFMEARRVGEMAGEIARVGQKASGVYFTPHRVDPSVLKRCKHALVEVSKKDGEARPKLTGDTDVTARRYLLIGVDPTRPAKVSATDAEKSAAAAVADAVRSYLAGHRWRAPLVVDSGNGFHLYYRLPELLPGGPADSQTDPAAVLLRVLKARFDTEAASIDGTVFNPSRIMKVPGTVARKGEPTPDRPHRPCTVLEVPGDWRT
jgi:hypothetical protein